MKTITTLLALTIGFFTVPIWADYNFIDDAPAGFIHTQKPRGDSVSDCFIRTEKVVAVEVFKQEIDGKIVPSVEIITQAMRGERTLSYFLNFDDESQANRVAQRIMQLINAEQEWADPPATVPEGKSAGDKKP
jgi:hypothetical protein